MEWSQPDIQGDLVTPRAGHAGITIDDMWYIVGGGDNKNGKKKFALRSSLFQSWDVMLKNSYLTGCLETLVLNMSKLAWTTLTTLKERHPIASEVTIWNLIRLFDILVEYACAMGPVCEVR